MLSTFMTNVGNQAAATVWGFEFSISTGGGDRLTEEVYRFSAQHRFGSSDWADWPPDR